MDVAERKRRYSKEKITVFELKFSETKDMDIVAKLDTVDSKQGYLRMLIKNDLIRQGIIHGPLESYDMVFHRGREFTTKHNCRTNLKLVTDGPDQPLIDYLQNCKSKIDYIRSLIRRDIDEGGKIANKVTTPKSYTDIETVLSSAVRTVSLLEDLSIQDPSHSVEVKRAIDSLNRWIDRNK